MPEKTKKTSELSVKKKTAEKALSQAMLTFEACLQCVPLQKDKFECSCVQTCRLLQELNKHDRCLEWIGEVISVNTFEKGQLDFLVTQWAKCKLLNGKNLKVSFGTESKSIIDYISRDTDQTVAVNVLIAEVNYYKQLMKRPPTLQFQTLSNLLKSCEITSPIAFLAQGLLVHLSHTWPDDFSSFCNISVIELFKSCCKSETLWEVKFITAFYSFVFSYECTLLQITESRQKFISSEVSLSNSTMLKWFPSDTSVPDRGFLISMVDLLKYTTIKDIFLNEEVLQCFQVLIMLLDLFEERVLIKETLKILEPILKSYTSTGKLMHYIWLVWIKCYQSNIASRLEMPNEALSKAEEALLLVNNFDDIKGTFTEKLTKFLESKLQYVFVEAQLTYTFALIKNKKISEACNFAKNILKNDFINSSHVFASRTSALSSSRVDFLLSCLSEHTLLDSVHPLNSAIASLSTVCMRLDMVCPGIICVLSCYESPGTQQQAPYFGKNSKTFSFDMTFQFEYILQLFSSLYRVSHLWLKSGNVRFSRMYITDGIILSRYLSLPEQELKFERLMVELALIEQDVDRLCYELSIMSDVMNYIFALHSKEKHARRTKLCSANACNEKNIKENINFSIDNDDEDFFVKSVELDIVSVVSRDAIDSASSPTLPRKAFVQAKEISFFHSQPCNCHICSNFFLLLEQCKLALYTAKYYKLSGNDSESMKFLDLTKNFVSNNIKNFVHEKPDDCKFQGLSSIEIVASLAEILFQCGDIQSSKNYTYIGVQFLKEYPYIVDSYLTSTLFRTAGQVQFSSVKFAKNYDTSLFVDKIIDLTSKWSCSQNLEKIVETGISRIKLSSENTAVRKKSASEKPKSSKITSSSKFKIYEDDCKTNVVEKKQTKKMKSVSMIKKNHQICQPSIEPIQNDVFDFPLDDNDEASNASILKCKTPKRRTKNSKQQSIQNVVAARKEAKRRHKKEWGMLYIDDEIEGARPASRKKRAANVTKKKDAGGLESTEILLNKHTDIKEMFANLASFSFSCRDVDMTKLDCQECLEKAYHISTLSCNFHTAKQTAQLLAMHHFKKKDIYKSASYHIVSIGMTLRITSHVNMVLSFKSIERKLKKKKETEQNDFNHEQYLQALQNMIDFTHPKQSLTVTDSKNYIDHICSKLPADWSVCNLSLYNDDQQEILMITRLRKNKSPLHLQLDGKVLKQLNINFNHFMDYNVKGMKATDKSLWWTQRRNANKLLESFNNELEKSLAYHAGILLGSCTEERCQNNLKKCFDAIIDGISKIVNSSMLENRNLLEIYSYVWGKLSPKDKVNLVLHLLSIAMVRPEEETVVNVAAVFEQNTTHFTQHSCKRGHVILILDKGLQRYPWESLSVLRNQSVSRVTSVDTLLWQLELHTIDNYAKANLSKVSYVVNPNKDLLKTEERFAEWFSSISTWHGVISRVPSKSELVSCVSDHDVFLFCGHGSGFPSLFSNILSRRHVSASALLMGCSSGVLKENGLTEPEGTAISYLMSGSPCVLACLWAVTDKDIDLYLAKCLTEWMKEGTSLTETVRKSESACRFPKLNGAACIVYGVPVYSCKSVSHWLANVPVCFKEVLI